MNEYILCAAIWYKEISLKREIPSVLPKNCDKGIVVTGYKAWAMHMDGGLLNGFKDSN